MYTAIENLVAKLVDKSFNTLKIKLLTTIKPMVRIQKTHG